MDGLALARALHVLGVIIWIGGVWMVTTIVLPAAAQTSDPVAFAEAVERRFSRHAGIAVIVVGATGFYMTSRWDLWDRFREPAYWWMHAMVGVWLLFTVILFVAEPLFLHRWFEMRAQQDLPGTLRLVQRLHWLLLALSMITTFGVVTGSHGWLFL